MTEHRGENFRLLLPGDGRILRQEAPSLRPEPGEVLVETKIVGLCASDLALYQGSYSAPHERLVCFGHEWAGIVLETGPQVDGLGPGDAVTGECSLACGSCEACQANPNLCPDVEKFGITTEGAARARFVIAARHLHRAPQGLSLAILALAEPLAVSAMGIEAAGIERFADARVLILGAGMLGLGCLMLLRQVFGARQVSVHDPDPRRMALAGQLGGERLPHGWLEDATEATHYRALYQRQGFDLVIEASGSAEALRQGIVAANPGGAVVLLGFAPPTALPVRSVITKGLRLVGSIGGSGMFETIVPWLAGHAETLSRLIDTTLPVAGAQNAFEMALARTAAPKVQLRFDL
jgi:threonine dehydrogenase-like Zn-dependent dehydrogenase